MRHKQRYQELEGLTPIVREALEKLRPVPAPDPEAWEADRQAFLAQAQTYSTEAVSTPPIERGVSLWMLKLKKFLTISFKEAPMLAFVKVFLVLAVAMGGSVGAAEATHESLPGSPLYPLKLQLEDWQLDFTPQPATRAEVAMRLAERRLDEALELADREGEIPMEVAERYQAHLETALQAMEAITTPQRERVQARLAEQLQAMLEQLPEDVPEEAIAAMTRAMTTAQERVGAAGPPDDVGPPEEAGPPSDIPENEDAGPPEEAGPPSDIPGDGEDDDDDEDAGPPDDAGPPEEVGPPSDIPGDGEDGDDEDAGPPDEAVPPTDVPGDGDEDTNPPDEAGPPDGTEPPSNLPGG